MATIKAHSRSYSHDDIVPVPGYVDSKLLAAATAESFTVPSGAKSVRLHSASPAATFAKFDGTATVPGDIADGTAPHMLSAEGRWFTCEGVTTISVISSGTPIVVAEFFK